MGPKNFFWGLFDLTFVYAEIKDLQLSGLLIFENPGEKCLFLQELWKTPLLRKVLKRVRILFFAGNCIEHQYIKSVSTSICDVKIFIDPEKKFSRR